MENLMNNLTQTQANAKQSLLSYQKEQLLKMYNVADIEERKTVVNHIYAFLSIVSQDEKIFWLKFINELQKLDERPKPLFLLGKVFLTIGAREALEESNQSPSEFLARHEIGDWGIIGKEDSKENDLSVKEGFRILSAYKTKNEVKIWIITEADRSSTTILLPEEY